MTSRWRYLAPAWLRTAPADLLAVGAVVALTAAAVFLPVVSETPLRVVVGLAFVLFVPGYAFVAALFPESGAGPVGDDAANEDAVVGDGADADAAAGAGLRDRAGLRDGGIDGIERVALSFGTSIAIVPLIGLVLNFTPWGIRLAPIVFAVGGFTVACAAVGTHRRNQLPPEERLVVPFREWYAAGRTELLEPESRADAALNVLLVGSVVLAAASVGYAVAVPKQGEQFTEFYLLGETDDGELVADNYPQNFTAGEPQSLFVGIGNQEHEPVNYTVVVLVQNVSFVDNETTVHEQERLRTFDTGLAHNETWHLNHTVAPTMTGERLRLAYLLYRDGAPARPSVANAYRETHLWVNVSARQAG